MVTSIRKVTTSDHLLISTMFLILELTHTITTAIAALMLSTTVAHKQNALSYVKL